jgi:hypothetical protein
VSAYELSELAKDLEAAGNRKDIAFIKTQTDAFLTVLQAYLNDINEVLSQDEKNRES